MLWGVIVVAFAGLVYALWLWRDTIRRDKGTKEMQEVWNSIKVGADAYLRRQIKTIWPILLMLVVLLFLSVYVVKPSDEAMERFGDQAQLVIALGRAGAFVLGATFSLVVGQLGMRVAVEGNVRVIFNPTGTSLNPGEILVCPGTDPAWTPLFLAAGGLIMEVGGMMTHGSVVAREYGIPAVVGVHRATERLSTGDRIRVDGSSGQITILDHKTEGAA
jgi:phosphohistidine swiveling domain-containing protein